MKQNIKTDKGSSTTMTMPPNYTAIASILILIVGTALYAAFRAYKGW